MPRRGRPKKRRSSSGYKCGHSVWPGFKRGGGGAGYRCRSGKTGRYVKQGHCKRCPAKVRSSHGKRGYTVKWKTGTRRGYSRR